MCVKNAILTGFEGKDKDSEPFTFTTNCTVETSNPRTNSKLGRGGAGHLKVSTSGNGNGCYAGIRRCVDVGWTEILIDFAFSFANPEGSIGFCFINENGYKAFSMYFSGADGRFRINASPNNHDPSDLNPTSGTTQATSNQLINVVSNKWYFASIKVYYAGGASTGSVEVRVNQKGRNSFSATNLDLNAPSAAYDGTFIQTVSMCGEWVNYMDDVCIRPRAIRVDGVTSGTPTIGNTITDAVTGATAVITGWESQTTDSGAGPGDPDLASNEFRLFIRNTSFDADPLTSDAVFGNNNGINNTGLTGTIVCNAPHSAFKCGLEPGGQYFGPALFIESKAAAADGADTGAWTNEGGATDHADAVDTIPVETTKYIQSTSDAQRASVTTTALANQSTIQEIVALSIRTYASTDGSSPNSIIPRLIDNSTDIDGTEFTPTSTPAAINEQIFDTTAAGGQWAKGTGAGTEGSVQVGVESSTV